MTPEIVFDIKASIKKRRLQYNKSIFDYLSDFLPTAVLVLVDVFLIIQLVMNSGEGVKSLVIIGMFILAVTLSVVLTVREYKRLDLLEEIKLAGQRDQNRERSKAIATKLGWTLQKETEAYLIYRKRWGLVSSGENITIIPCDDIVFVNSAAYLRNDIARTTLSFGVNQRNIRRFSKLIGTIK